jgi:hypothetical protein
MRIRIFRSILWITRQGRMVGRLWEMGGCVYFGSVLYCTNGMGLRDIHWQLVQVGDIRHLQDDPWSWQILQGIGITYRVCQVIFGSSIRACLWVGTCTHVHWGGDSSWAWQSRRIRRKSQTNQTKKMSVSDVGMLWQL